MMSRDIKYMLVVTIDGQRVFKSIYADTTGLQEDLYKAEQAVEDELIWLEENEDKDE